MVASGATGASAHVLAPNEQCSGPSVRAVSSGSCPGAPTLLTATVSDGTVTLSWTAPASDGGSSVTSYNVYSATSADFKGATKVPGVTGTAVTVTGLVNGTRITSG